MAAINRVPSAEVESLLHDPGFATLLEHYRSFAAMAPEVRLERLAAAALHMLELAVETGDLKACMFVLHETRRGRNPARRLAEEVERRVAAEALRNRPVPARRPPGPPRRPPRAEIGNPWTHCAATRDDEADAMRVAECDLAAVPRDRELALDRLSVRLMAEVEREWTAQADGDGQALRAQARAIARHHHGRPAESLAAATRLHDHRRGMRAGELPPPGPLRPG